MIIDDKEKQILMEARDINYILPAYVRSYLFYSKNELPEKIIFPMFPSVLVQGKEIPIEYVSPLDAVAVEIAKDGTGVAEVTPEQEATLDEKDEKIRLLREEVAILSASKPEVVTPAPEDLVRQQEETAAEEYEAEHGDTPRRPEGSVSPAKAAFAKAESTITPSPADRQPKQPPGGDIGPGLGLSDTHARDRRDQTRTARDLMEEPNINEAEEKEFDQTVSRDEEGRPVVEDKPERHATS